MEVTLQDLLHAINILGDDRDVTVDGIDTRAVCPPVKMTPLGREHFKQALTANVVVEYKNDSHLMGGETKRAKLDEVKVYGSRDVSVS